MAVTTGLMRRELAALRSADLHLEAATLRVRAPTSKIRRAATHLLQEGTVAALGRHARRHAATQRLTRHSTPPR